MLTACLLSPEEIQKHIYLIKTNWTAQCRKLTLNIDSYSGPSGNKTRAKFMVRHINVAGKR